MTDVYFVPATAQESDRELAEKTTALWRHAALSRCLATNDLTAIKIHVGEPGNQTFIRPAIVAALVQNATAAGARPFLTDSVVLYKSPRDNAVGHLTTAQTHGFGFSAMGAPFVPADGLTGSDTVEIEIEGRHFNRVSIASTIAHARSLLIVSHATGHMGTALGAALKNLGMGCCAKKAKLKQHFGQPPKIAATACTGCGECARYCPVQAIDVNAAAVIDDEVCIGCGECVAICTDGAVTFGWSAQGQQLQERMVEHAAGVIKNKTNRIGYVTVAQTITKDCDCIGRQQRPLLEDIGILASTDPVSLDQAVVDLIKQRSSQTLESMSYPKGDSTHQMAYAEQLGIGERQYTLIQVPLPELFSRV